MVNPDSSEGDQIGLPLVVWMQESLMYDCSARPVSMIDRQCSAVNFCPQFLISTPASFK